MKKIISIVLCFIMLLSASAFIADAQDLQAIADSLSVDTITTETANFITKDLILPTEIDGVAVTWLSDSDAITNEGKVTRHATDEKAVKLTATIGGSVTKEIGLKVAPLTTQIVYQNNFGKKLDGTPFDTSKELIGVNSSTTQIEGWANSYAQTTAPFGTTVGETGGVLIDLNSTKHTPVFALPEKMDSPFYVCFDVKTQALNPGIEFRISYTPEIGNTVIHQTIRWNGGQTLFNVQYLNAYGGKLLANTEEVKTTMCLYIDPINLLVKMMDANGKFVPSNGIKLGNAEDKNGKINNFRICRAASSTPSGSIEIDNFVVYRTAAESEVYNDRIMLKALAESAEFSKFSDEDASSVTENLDFSSYKNEIESANPGIEVSFKSNNEDVLKIEGNTGVITRLYDDTPAKMEVVFSKGASKFCKTIEFTVAEAFNPAKQVANEIVFESISEDAPNAVTNNLDLSLDEFYASDISDGAKITFTSNDENALFIDGNVGYVMQGSEKKNAVLTLTVEKDGRSFAKNFEMTILPEGTYVYESENFCYPELADKSIGALDRWVVSDNYQYATYANIKKNNFGYHLETARVKKAGGYDNETFSFLDARKTKNVTVEMDLSADELPSGVTYDIYFMGVREDGSVISDVTKDMFYLRLTNNSLRLNASNGIEHAVTEGNTYRIKFDFDFENECFDYYVNGRRLASDIKWRTANTYVGLSYINFRSYRESANFRVGIDNLAVYSENPEFLYSELEDNVNSDRPLTVSASPATGYYISVTSDYDENYKLRQRFVEKTETFKNNPILDIERSWLVDKASGAQKDLVAFVNQDESNPQLLNGLYIGGNHGAMGARITSTAHGKTYADVGSIWLDSKGVRWNLIRIEDANTLFFIQDKTPDISKENFSFSSSIAGPLTYVSDGVNKEDITVTSFNANADHQTFPSIKNVKHTYYLVIDGEMIPVDIKNLGGSVSCDEFVMIEEYEIVNPATIAPTLRANRPEGGYTTAPAISVGDGIFSYKQILTVKGDGTLLKEIDHKVLTDLNKVETYGYQFQPRADAFGGGVWRQVPGTKEFTDGKGRQFDLSSSIEYTTVTGTIYSNKTYPNNVTLKRANWVDENIVPSRILDYFRDTEGKNVMGYMTGFLPLYDGMPSVRNTKTNYNIYMYDQKIKAYPYFVSSNGIKNPGLLTDEGATIKGVSYRKYVDLSEFEDNNTHYYSVDCNNKTYYYIDFQAADKQVINLEKSACIYNLAEVEKLGDITFRQVGETIVVESKGKGYLILEASRQLEVESAFKKAGSSSAVIRFVNYSELEKTVNVTVASYNGRKLESVKTVKNITIGANSTLNKDIDIAEINDENYKLFVFDTAGELVPVSKDVEIEIK